MTNNERLKDIMYQHRIAQWKLADKLGVSDITVFRKLCRPMKEDVYESYLKALEDIIEDNEKEREEH